MGVFLLPNILFEDQLFWMWVGCGSIMMRGSTTGLRIQDEDLPLLALLAQHGLLGPPWPENDCVVLIVHSILAEWSAVWAVRGVGG